MLEAARVVVAGSWLVLFGWFAWQWRHAQTGRTESGRRTNPNSLAGMALEMSALLLVAAFRSDPALPAPVYMVAAGLAVASAWFGVLAGQHLGKQLRIQAVVTDDHRLVTTGPYGVVRHPIYASLLGLLLATALTWSDPRVLVAALPVFLLGTEIRVRSEERLLAAYFGEQFEEYRRRVRAYLPGIR